MIKLILASLLFSLSLLVLFRAPVYFLWIADVLITSFPVVFIGLAMISFVSSFWMSKFQLLVLLLSFAAMIIFSLPILISLWVSFHIRSEVQKTFPSHLSDADISLIKMFSPVADSTFSTIPYKFIQGKQLTLDYYHSNRTSHAPLIVIVHGGSWQSGDSRQLPGLNTYLSQKGYNVAAINYRLAPGFKSPAPVEDAEDAIQYLISNARSLKIDTSSIVIIGRSAGAQIALVTSYSQQIPGLKGVISFYGPADMVWGGQIKSNKLVINTDKIYKNYFGGNYRQVPSKFMEASACGYVTKNSPPTLIIHGTNDPLVSFNHGLRLQDKLKKAGVRNYFLKLPLATHGCDYNLNSPYGQLTTRTVEKFIYSVTRQTWKN